MDEFHAVLIEGLFYRRDDGTLAADLDGQVTVVEELLDPCEGSHLKFVLQFVPPQPPQLDCWGAGCCMWEPSGRCPAGHHDDPGKMLNFHHEGLLTREGDRWLVGDRELPLDLLEGHHSRVIGVSNFDPATLGVLQEGDLGSLGDMMGEVERIREVLSRLQAAIQGK